MASDPEIFSDRKDSRGRSTTLKPITRAECDATVAAAQHYISQFRGSAVNKARAIDTNETYFRIVINPEADNPTLVATYLVDIIRILEVFFQGERTALQLLLQKEKR